MSITRFAPSPTGYLHLGHAFAAKVARESGEQFLLRFEDIDHTRVRSEYYTAIEEDLRWLGLTWQGTPWRQLDRLPIYNDALQKLKALGVVYPCYCTRSEIEAELAELGNAPQGPEGPLYPGTCRDLLKKLDREPAWRLHWQKASERVGDLTFNDSRHGLQQVNPGLLGDVILARKDIGTSYHLAVVVDDAAQQITTVTRGEDLLPSTHIHRVLQALLDFPEPQYLHHRLILDDQGNRLAKRHDALAIRQLRELGLTPEQVFQRL